VSLSTLGLAALRRLAHTYRRILVLAVPAADAGLAALNQHRILYSAQVAEEEYDLFSMGPGGGNVTHLTHVRRRRDEPGMVARITSRWPRALAEQQARSWYR
jgi:hypothetical protein